MPIDDQLLPPPPKKKQANDGLLPPPPKKKILGGNGIGNLISGVGSVVGNGLSQSNGKVSENGKLAQGINVGGAFDAEGDDPIGNALSVEQRNAAKYIYPDVTTGKPTGISPLQSFQALNKLKESEGNLMNTFAGNADVAQEYITKELAKKGIAANDLNTINQYHNPKNLTQKLAVQSLNKIHNIKTAISDAESIEDAAIEYFKRTEDEKGRQAKFYDNMAAVPDEVMGEWVDKFTSDPDVLALAKHDKTLQFQIDAARNNMYQNFPKYVENVVKRKIGQERENRGMNSLLANNPSVEKTEEVASEMLSKGKLSKNEYDVWEKRIKPVLGALHEVGAGSDVIPTPDMQSSLGEGLEQGFGGILSTIKQIGAISDTERKNKLTSENIRKEYASLGVQSSSEIGKVLNTSAHLTGFLAPMVLGGAARVPSMVTNAIMFGGANMDRAQTMFPGDQVKQDAYTVLTTGADVFMGGKLPFGKVQSEIKILINKFSSGQITGTEAKSLFIKLVEGNAKTGGVITGFGAVHNAADAVFGGKDLSAFDIAKQAMEDAPLNFFAATPLSLMHSIGRNKTTNGETIKSAVESPEIEKKILESGNQEAIQNFQTAKNAWAEIKDLDIPEDKKGNFLLKDLQQKVFEEKAASSNVDVNKNKWGKLAKEAEIEKGMIYNPDRGVQKDVQEFYENDLLPKGVMESLEVDGKFSPAKVGGVLKELAQQANNLDADWKPHEGDIKMTKPNVPDALIEMANERWKDKIPQPKEIESPQEPAKELADNELSQKEKASPVSGSALKDVESDVVQNSEYKGVTGTTSVTVKEKDGIIKATFKGTRSDKPGATIGASGYRYGGRAVKETLSDFEKDYGVKVDEIIDGVEIAEITVLEERAEVNPRQGVGTGQSVTLRIRDVDGNIINDVNILVNKRKFTEQSKAPTQYTEAAGVSGSALKDAKQKLLDDAEKNNDYEILALKNRIDKGGVEGVKAQKELDFVVKVRNKEKISDREWGDNKLKTTVGKEASDAFENKTEDDVRDEFNKTKIGKEDSKIGTSVSIPTTSRIAKMIYDKTGEVVNPDALTPNEIKEKYGIDLYIKPQEQEPSTVSGSALKDVEEEITKNKARNDRHTELLYKDNKTKEEKAEYNEIDAERFSDRKKLIPNASEGRDEMYDDVHDAILGDNEMPNGYSAIVTDSYYEPIMQSNHTIAKVTKPNGEQFYVDVNTYHKQDIGKTYGKAVEKLIKQSKAPTQYTEAATHRQNIHDKFRKEFEGKGVPKEQVDGAIALLEARAKSWASEEKGRTPEQWFGRIADVKDGEFEQNTEKQYQVEAYHGSPHDFDKFSTSKIGTGEGAQAFGHGLYFTDLKGIAEGYAEKLSETKIKIDGQDLLDFIDSAGIKTRNKGWLQDVVGDASTKGAAIRNIDGIIKFKESKIADFEEIINDPESTRNERAIAQGGLNSAEIDLQNLYDLHNAIFRSKDYQFLDGKRNLYQVTLHEGKTPEQYDWLGWDKDLPKEKIDKIKKALFEYDLPDGYSWATDANKNKNHVVHQIKDKDGNIVGEGIDKQTAAKNAGIGQRFHPYSGEEKRNAEFDKVFKRNSDGKYTTGAGFYHRLSELLGSDKAASDLLLKAGIDGVKYPAESIARGTTSDNARGFNYVVFDENAVTIKNKIQFQENKGAVETLADGRKVIHALDAPDFSTMVHEIAHVFEGDLTKAEQKIVKDFGGSEPFARGFEKYLRDGKAPTTELKTLFEKFKQWLTNIYKTLKGSPIEKRISPEIKQIFDRLLTEKGEPKAPTQYTEADIENKQSNQSPTKKIEPVEKVTEDSGGTGQKPPPGTDVGGGEGGKKKSLPNRLIEATNLSDDIKEGISREGLTYNPRSHRQAQALADAIIENEGIEKAVLQAQAGKFGGDVNTLVQTSALDKIAELSAKETNHEKQLEYAKQFVDIETGLDNWLRNQAGRGISALAHFYKKTPLGVVMKENKVRGEQFETWAKPKDKSWHEFFDELMKEPDFEKEVSVKVKEELKKERQESRKARIKKVDEWFDKAKKDIEGKNGVVYSTVIPPKIISAALEGMKQAYHAGEKVAEIVQNAIDEISAALGNAKWDKEKFRKEWEDKLKDSAEKKPLTDEEIKTRILDKFRKKLKGLSDKERDEVIRRSFKKIIESGGLDYEDFRKIIGEVTGHGELTPEQANKIKELVKITNSVDDAGKKAREERTPEALKNFRNVENEAGKAAKELQDIFQNKPDILKRLTSIMQLNTLGVASLVNNPVYNIMNQSGVRFPIGVINSLIDIAKNPTEREYNIIASQKEFWNKLGLGTSESIKQLFTGLSRMDYIQKEIHGQRIRPFKAWRDLFTKKKMSGVEITDKILQGTVGIPAEAVARVLNIGDKPQRFAAEGAQASAFAKALGLKDMDYKLFIEFPREEAYRVYKAQGLSDAEASNKADYVKEAIVKEGERSTFQQDNLLNDFLTRAFGVFGGKDSGASQLLKTITVSPYIKIPSNAFWSMYNLLNPEVALAQSFIYGARSRYFKGKGEYVKQKMQGREARYWFAHAITGMAARAVVLSLVGGGVFTPSSDDKDSKKERDATSFYDKTGAFHINGMDVSGKWFGQWGMLFNAIAKKEKDMTPDQRAKQSEWWRTMFGGMEIDGLKEAENSLFGNASTLLQAVNGGDFDRYLTNQIGMFANIIQPASVAQLNRANEDYVPSSRGDDLISKIDQQFAQRSPLYRAITGTHVEKKLDIWGQPIPKGGNVLSRMFGISKSETKQFGRPIYEDAVRTGDSGFLPPAVLPTLNGKKLKESEYRDLQNRIGSERKSLVAPYVNDMSIVSGFNVKYSELSDADKKFVLNYLYDKGREDGLKKFYQDFPELEPKEKQRDYQQEAKEKVFKVLEKYKNR